MEPTNASAKPDVPAMMRAALLLGQGGPDMLEVRNDVPVPSPGADQVLIHVAACGMNNTDINTRVGWYSRSVTTGTSDEESNEPIGDDATWGGSALTFPRIQGADPSGRVVAVGSNADPALIGRRVLADPWSRDSHNPLDRSLARYRGSELDGGFAEYCVVNAANVYPHDSTLSDVELASLPCSWSTAEHMLQRVRLQAGQTIAVTGASGGVGSALVQLAKLRDATVLAVCGDSKMATVRELGADHVLSRGTQDLGAAAMELNGGGFDVVADVVGGTDFVGWLEALRRGGRYVTAGAIAGPIVDLDLRTLYLNDLELYGATVYEPNVFADLMSYIDAGQIRPTVGGTFALEDIHAAQEAGTYNNMPIAFITGVSGQDGSYLAELLLSKGYEVHGLIRRSSSINTHRLDGIYEDPLTKETNFHLHYGDLADSSGLARLIREIQPDEVYNLAAQSHVKVSFEMPEFTVDVTGTGVLRLLEAVRMNSSTTRFYQASSSEMFGATPPPQNEHTPFHPRSPYSCAKLLAHSLCVNYRESYDMYAVSGILFNHESPRRGETFVTRKISRAVAMIQAGKQEALYLGNLDAKRDWGFAGDYVEAMWLMLQQDEPKDYVIGIGEAHSVRDFCEAAFSHVGLNWQDYVRYDARYERPAEVDFLLSDASKAREELGWEPKRDLVAEQRGGEAHAHLNWYQRRSARDPIMVVAFSGWNDAGNAASSAAEYLEQTWSAAPFATVDAEEFFDFTTIRPSIELTQTGGRRISWPNTTFAIAEGALQGRDLIIVRGTEPQLKWRTFTDTLLGVASDMGVSMIVSFGALLADVPHTRPTVVYGSSSGDAKELGDLEPSTYEGPTGIIGVLHSACSVQGIPYASLWAAVPTYVPGAVSPKAALALLKKLRDLLGAEFETDELQRDAQEYVRQVDSYVEEDPETVEFIGELERHYDANHEASPEQLVAEVEQFLRQRGDL
ncbi:GDP-mannose 4,6 dehydratase 1 [Nymphon striatum]|nr:GDP-mannose 4,6 dehydratase 1 [Nymphon striatum]